jgi:hypothetical protein
MGPTFIPLLRYFWFFVASGSFLDWFFSGGRSYSLRSLCLVYLFSGWSMCAPIFFCSSSGLLAPGLCGVRETIAYSEVLEFLRAIIGQDQDFLL